MAEANIPYHTSPGLPNGPITQLSPYFTRNPCTQTRRLAPPSLKACLSLDHGLDAILEYFARYLPNSHLLTIHRQLWRLDENLVS